MSIQVSNDDLDAFCKKLIKNYVNVDIKYLDKMLKELINSVRRMANILNTVIVKNDEFFSNSF